MTRKQCEVKLNSSRQAARRRFGELLELARQIPNPKSVAFVVDYDTPVEQYQTYADGTIGGYVKKENRKY